MHWSCFADEYDDDVLPGHALDSLTVLHDFDSSVSQLLSSS